MADHQRAVAAVDATLPPGVTPATDLSTVAAKNVTVLFRDALPGEIPHTMHAYIDITRANGAHQVLGAYPVGGLPMAHEGGQLVFSAGQEKGHIPKAAFELQVPPHMTLTQYANSLVTGATSYNQHALRYDGLGEEGVNGNSFVSSLIVAKGGATGLADVERIAAVVDTSPVHTAGQGRGGDDSQSAQLIHLDADVGRMAAPGFGNATIEPRRFSHDRVPVPSVIDFKTAAAAIRTVGDEIRQAAGDEVNRLRGVPHLEPTVQPAHMPYLPTGPLTVRYNGEVREFEAGYRQSGVILAVRDGIVTQSTGRGTAEYQISDLTRDARDPKAMEEMLVPGRDVQVQVGSDHVHVTSLDRNQDLDRAQQHASMARDSR